MGVLTRSEDVAEGQGRPAQAVEGLVGVEVLLHAALAGSVRGPRVAGKRLVDGQLLGIGLSVDRAARARHRELRHAGASAGLQQPHRPHDVDHRVVNRILDAVADVDLSRQVQHGLGPGLGHHVVDVGCGDVDGGDGQRVAVVAPGVVEVVHLARGQVVDDGHLVAVREQPVGEVGADEAGSAAYEHACHLFAFCR